MIETVLVELLRGPDGCDNAVWGSELSVESFCLSIFGGAPRQGAEPPRVGLSVCLCVCLSVCMSVCLSVCVSVTKHIPVLSPDAIS